MFEHLQALASDPILGLSQAFQHDENPNKVDLGVGVYKDEQGNTPVLSAVIEAQRLAHEREITKAYQGPVGNRVFNELMQKLIFGENNPLHSRLTTLQTPGGCGALWLGAKLIANSRDSATIWVSRPTWANHIPLMQGAGLTIKEYPYYDASSQSIDVDAMMSTLEQVPAGDLVLLHGCCHNPCGTDLNLEQWQAIAQLAQKNGFIPFVDLAYQGFGDGLEEDAQGLRLLAAAVPELLVASSCSKNFGLYRERAGALSVLADSTAAAEVVFSHMQNASRAVYSMPPAHGATLVETILTDAQLCAQWQGEVGQMRDRIKSLRQDLAQALAPFGDFGFIPEQRGMFSFLGLTAEQVARLKSQYSIYMVDSSRINLAGINQRNLPYLADSIGRVIS
ncbi:MAG: aromatic amino acid aminotransferase [Cellvibrionaceae bacterium]|nr:aromatic amino acid aminotransferase [Cellvibrionaceae bacterium]